MTSKPEVLGPYVHPATWGGVAYHAPLRLLAVSKKGVLVWLYAGSTWGGTLVGTEPVEGSLEFLPYVAHSVHVLDNSKNAIVFQRGGRLSQQMLDTHRDKIESVLGPERGEWLHPRKCILFDGVSLPPKSVLPESKPSVKLEPAKDLTLEQAKALMTKVKARFDAADLAPMMTDLQVGGVGVLVSFPRFFKVAHTPNAPWKVRMFTLRLDTQAAGERFEAEVEALRKTMIDFLASYREKIPVRFGQPLVAVAVEFKPSAATEVAWTPSHRSVIRKAAALIFTHQVQVELSDNLLVATVTLTNSSPKQA